MFVLENENQVSGIGNIKNLIVAPGKLYEGIKEKPTFLLPILIVFVLLILNLFLSQNVVVVSSEEIAKQLVEITGNAKAADIYMQGMAMASGATGVNIIIIVTTIVSFVFMTLGGTLWTLILSKLFGGDATFKQMLSVNCYNKIILYIFSVVSVICMILLKTSTDIFSLSSVFMPNGNTFDITYILMSTITIPAVYIFVLNVIGIKVVSNFETYTKSIIICLINYGITVLVSIASIVYTIYIYSNL